MHISPTIQACILHTLYYIYRGCQKKSEPKNNSEFLGKPYRTGTGISTKPEWAEKPEFPDERDFQVSWLREIFRFPRLLPDFFGNWHPYAIYAICCIWKFCMLQHSWKNIAQHFFPILLDVGCVHYRLMYLQLVECCLYIVLIV